MDAEAIRELFAAFGLVSVRRMFGGAGVYADGIIIAIVADGVIYLKADAHTVPRFEAEALGPFIYQARTSKRAVMSYWRMPDRLYDDQDELAEWAREALAAARRTAAGKSKPKSGSKPKSPKSDSKPKPKPKRGAAGRKQRTGRRRASRN